MSINSYQPLNLKAFEDRAQFDGEKAFKVKNGQVRLVDNSKSGKLTGAQNETTRKAFFNALSQRYPNAAQQFESNLFENPRAPLRQREVSGILEGMGFSLAGNEDKPVNFGYDRGNAPDKGAGVPKGGRKQERFPREASGSDGTSETSWHVPGQIRDVKGPIGLDTNIFNYSLNTNANTNSTINYNYNYNYNYNNNNNNNNYNSNNNSGNIASNAGVVAARQRLEILNSHFAAPKHVESLTPSELKNLVRLSEMVEKRAGSLNLDTQATAVELAFDQMGGKDALDETQLLQKLDYALELLTVRPAKTFPRKD